MSVCQYILLVFVVLLASTVTAQANKAQFIQAKVTPAQHPGDSLMIHRSNGFKERSLRTADTDSGADDEYTVDEERGVQVAILSKLSNWATKMKLE
ncbi:RxLR effector protein [Phytophthora megakarya]|uniref:RxLR effector protein n=1 Tax=Phytophthora megakarya TaxID=4795 RepID=A0A225VPN0_9STRA|nr:RxLR effector protein [Phytophthora megakarya]